VWDAELAEGNLKVAVLNEIDLVWENDAETIREVEAIELFLLAAIRVT
jgi:hypothetical protein